MAKSNGSAQPSFSPFMDMTKFMPDMKMPGFDVEAVMQAQRRAGETMTEMGQKALSSMQAVMQRQGEMVRETMQESAGLMSEVMAAGTPEEKVARQTDMAKTAFDKAMANSRELMEMMTQANRETAEMMTSRFTEAMEQMRSFYTRRS